MTAQGSFSRISLTRRQRERFDRLRRLDQLKNMDPVEFERFCGYLYEQQGYQAFMTATSGDEGVDLLLKRGRDTVVVQCKRYAGTVGQPTVRDLYGTMVHNNANASVLMTTGNISRAAEAWAVGKPIELIDGHDLMSWISTNRRSRAGGGWFARNLGRMAIVAVLLLALGACLATVPTALRLFAERTDDGNTALVIPTSPVTSTPAPTPVDQDAAGAPAPTVTLRPTATPPAGTTAADFTIPEVSEPLPLAAGAPQWQAIPAVALTHIVEQGATWDGTHDVSALWKLAYDDRNLYGLVVVEDDILSQTQPARSAYRGDSLELEIDTLGDRAERAASDDYQYIISPGNFADLAPEAFRFRGENGVMVDDWGTNAVVRAERLPAGYAIAFSIPWFDLRVYEPPTAETMLGVALNVNDNDSPGEALQEFMLSHVATRRWSRPASWGSMTLEGSP